MALKSVYLPNPQSEDGRLRLVGDEHHHLTVARAEAGEIVEVLDGRGGVWTAEIVSVGRKESIVRVIEARQLEKSGPEVILALSLIKPSAFELALEKAVEVGVTQIIPTIASRSNAAPGRRLDRWNRVVIEASKQSKRYHFPVVHAPARFAQVLDREAATKIVFAERGGGPLESALAGSPALGMVGPEGGWTDAELELARARGFRWVTLDDGILRSETAAIVGAALLRYELLRNR
jgi:16S rRNA (uracil1498-N3)-methyltransferase